MKTLGSKVSAVKGDAPKVSAIASWFGSNRMLAPRVGEALTGCDWVGIVFAGGMCEAACIVQSVGFMVRAWEPVKASNIMAIRYLFSEIRAGEKFVFNSESNSDLGVNWPGLKTIRMGTQALDIDGKLIPQNYMRPVFVHESELDQLDRIWAIKLAR